MKMKKNIKLNLLFVFAILTMIQFFILHNSLHKAQPIIIVAEQNMSVKQSNVDTSKVETIKPYREYTEEDLYWFSHIIYAESGTEDDIGQRLVGEVVLRRVDSELFPDTIYDVIFQEDGKQFSPVKDGSIDLEPSEQAIENAKYVLEHDYELTTPDILFFRGAYLGESNVGDCWWDGVEVSFVHGNHAFAKVTK